VRPEQIPVSKLPSLISSFVQIFILVPVMFMKEVVVATVG